MVLDQLGKSIRETLKRIANSLHVDKKLVKEVTKELQRALLQADVEVKLVFDISRRIEKRALEEKPPAGMTSQEHTIRILYQELSKILGSSKKMELKPQLIIMIGLYGQGKTTTCAKLADYFKRKGLRPALIGTDVHRPGAYDQLSQLADKLGIPSTGPDSGKGDAIKLAREGIEKLRHQADVIIVDTAGRDRLDAELIKEMKGISKVAQPDEKLLILDATMGQRAGEHAKTFHEQIGLTGVILTKLDGTAKGGGALSAVAATGVPIAFIGTGEHIRDLEKFDPERFISRLLGMGDLQTLLERAKEIEQGATAKEAAKNIARGKFTLNDLYQQMESLSSMGPLNKVFEMLPGGVSKKVGSSEIDKLQGQLQKFRVIMDSMTEMEKENPSSVKSSNILRIARGAGVELGEVRKLIKYYENSKKMMKGIKSNRKMQRVLAKQFGMR
jgi:signal recognition particle subunit SRP54